MKVQILRLVTYLSILCIFGPEKGISKERYEEGVILSLIRNIEVEKPVQYKNLTLFPLSLNLLGDKTHYLTLDEAIRKGDLVIKELGDGIVNEVLVENRSNHYVFLMAGELIKGSKQDRMISYDCLLPPNSKKVRLQVYCVEQGRWTQNSQYFESIGESAHIRMRERAKKTKSQGEVWDEVGGKSSALGVSPSSTQAFRKVLEDSEVQKEAKPYLDELSRIPNLGRNIFGVVAITGGEILVCDLFTNRDLFEKLWSKLLRSYVLEVISLPVKESSLTRNDVKAFVRNVLEAEFSRGETDGVGRAFEISSGSVFGSALVHSEQVIHLDLFPGGTIPLHDSPMDLDFRREQRNR